MIESTDNAKVKYIIRLRDKARERRKENCFIAEGRRMVRETPMPLLKEVLISESYMADPEKKKEAETYFKNNIITVSDKVMEKMSGTDTPQGIMAVVKIPTYDLNDIINKQNKNGDSIIICLENIQDPGNLGTIFRTAEAAGVSGIVMTKDSADLFSPKVVRSTMGSLYRMPFFIADDLPAALADMKAEGVSLYAAHLKGKTDHFHEEYKGKIALLIGNEGNGLSEESTALCDKLLRIPMAGKTESLNAAMAAGILMYTAYSRREERL
ncbi:MAG: 23S rRNA (guanosine(2251)-2'-O)-methyltransferase RlmB [Lachnospiraceae bacterium]|nr:23S rRNA (guanosine(2251)-2'-O)-methyltransferase RlmB [Lachnospiraceae bacterium]